MPRKTTKRANSAKKKTHVRVSPLDRLLSPLIFLVAGCIFLALALFFQARSATKYSFGYYNFPISSASESAYPTFISIKKIEVHLPVKPTQIIDGEWQIREDSVSYLAASGVPGEKKNIILYSHNTKNFFKRLPELGKDDIITLVTINGDAYVYKVVNTYDVSPDDVWVLRNNNKEELTLYTCYGFADLKRFVVKAEPLLASTTATTAQ